MPVELVSTNCVADGVTALEETTFNVIISDLSLVHLGTQNRTLGFDPIPLAGRPVETPPHEPGEGTTSRGQHGPDENKIEGPGAVHAGELP